MSSKQRKTNMPLAPLESIMKELTDLRISASGVEELRAVLHEVVESVVVDAAEFAKFSKRITIKDRDVELAYKNFRKNRL